MIKIALALLGVLGIACAVWGIMAFFDRRAELNALERRIQDERDARRQAMMAEAGPRRPPSNR